MADVVWRRVEESRRTKLWRVARYLARHPVKLPRWLADRVASQSPMARQLPWFSWSAIRHLQGWLKPHHIVIEFGGGGSTLFFAPRVAAVVTIETDPSWAAALRSIIPPNVTLTDVPPEQTADLIIVDGPDDFTCPTRRVAAMHWALEHVRPGGLVVLDDSWAYRRYLPSGAELFIDIGPCRLGVTETAIVMC